MDQEAFRRAGERFQEHFSHPLQNLKVNMRGEERLVSALGGGVLVALGMRNRSVAGALLATTGAVLAMRGVTGHCPLYATLGINTAREGENTSVAYDRGIRVEQSIAIDRPAAELYAFWRQLDNLPRFMEHLEEVSVTGDRTSTWRATAPAGMSVEWDAEIINEIPGELIGWRSVGEADVDNAGSVHFQTLPGGRGTRVSVVLSYDPPGGALGSFFAKLFGEAPEQQIADDLRRFKQLMETGEIATTEGQSSAREESQ